MRLHSLAVEAFGPFAGREVVDFDALADGGLFLFTGPTGAGKTSVLDAVCFALYGQVPGARQHGRSLRSDHAPASRAPVVALETTLRGRRLRVTRSPAWDRPKQRGTGTTGQQARVLVQERVGEDWETVSTRLDEAGHVLGRLLGLSMAQFCQVVLLPQNQFAEFLRADADRRRALLESLFDTGRFASVESWLVERRRETARRVGGVDERLAAVLARTAEAAGETGTEAVPAPSETDRGGWPEHARTWATALLDDALTAAADASDAVQAATGARDRARTDLAAAEELQAARDRHGALSAALAALREEADAHAAVVEELRAARLAAPVLPLLAQLDRLDGQLAATAGRVTALAGAVSSQLPGSLAATGTDGGGDLVPAPVRGRAAEIRQEVGRLRGLADDEAEADRASAALGSLQSALVDLDRRHQEVEAWLTGAPAVRQGLHEASGAAREAAAALPGIRDDVHAAEQRHAAAQGRDALAASAGALREQHATASTRVQELRERWLDLRERRLTGIAAELAAALEAGAPCPVCGSPEHPLRARPTDDAVGRAEERGAQEDLERASAERDRVAGEVSGTEQELAGLTARAGDAPVARLASEAADLRALLRATTERADRLAAAATAAEQHEAAVERRVQERMALAVEASAVRTELATTADRLARLTAELAVARKDDPTVADRARRLAGLAEQCDELSRYLADGERLRADAEAIRRQATEAAAPLGRSDLGAVAAAGRDEAALRELEARRRTYESDLDSVQQQLREPALAAAAAAEAPALDALRTAVGTAEATHAGRRSAAEQASARAAALQRLTADLAVLLAEREPVARLHAVADGLSRLAEGRSGDNRLRMSLSAYVLAARLEAVAAAANDRLLRMTSGRYTLEHTAEPGSGRARGGLHLRVLDAWTGSPRDPASLSGGESFAASLALALGLADVVTAEAGGGALESLFVDEGFGSLDEETLDEVMGVLDGLRDGGRTVGLVSHVTELRQRIPVQLRVEKGRSGSRIVQS